MVILGGMGNVWGVMLGGVVLAYLNYQGLARDRQARCNDTFGTSIGDLRQLDRHLRHADRDHDAAAARRA